MTDRYDPLKDTRPWTAARWVVVDVEGNGRHPPDLVEAAVLPIIDGRVGEPLAWLVRPPQPITWQARRVHGITDADVASSPAVAEMEPEIVAALAGADVVVGHSVHVDLDVLTRSLATWTPGPALDTLRLARAVRPGLASYRLSALANELCLGETDQQRHRAGADATLAARLMLALIASRTRCEPGPTVAEVMSWGSKPNSPRGLPGQGRLTW